MNQLTSENETAKQIVSQLLENHQTIVSMISHEIRNPLTLVSSALQIIEIQHPEVINFHGWSQAIEDIEFMCNLLNELSDFNNGSTLHHSVFSLEKLLKNIAVSFAMSLDSINSNIEFTSKISLNSYNYTGDKIKFEEVILNLLQNAKDAVSEKTFTDSKGSIFLCAEKISDHGFHFQLELFFYALLFFTKHKNVIDRDIDVSLMIFSTYILPNLRCVNNHYSLFLFFL